MEEFLLSVLLLPERVESLRLDKIALDWRPSLFRDGVVVEPSASLSSKLIVYCKLPYNDEPLLLSNAYSTSYTRLLLTSECFMSQSIFALVEAEKILLASFPFSSETIWIMYKDNTVRWMPCMTWDKRKMFSPLLCAVVKKTENCKNWRGTSLVPFLSLGFVAMSRSN